MVHAMAKEVPPERETGARLPERRTAALLDVVDHLAADIAKFFWRNIFEPFPLPIKLLIDLDGRLLHDAVGFLGPPTQQEVLTPGDAGMSVVTVESQP